ncbi:ABC transporter ATP-binding protein [Alteromonas lipolytica]|uniref:Elongation factor 3 n=2 Tax=Alteromonas lipolytica TaxID=1856405 RepID=A0A1E8FJZ7_9ALTE|nr:elongation factor 3 [Alteromonas lipolytica]GGF71164.1 ABC transporter ATP-binding protein [Alteromonas lipolytica]
MPILKAQNLAYTLPTGDILFQSVSVTMTSPRVGLVGKNGCGKSILAAMLSGARKPKAGHVACEFRTAMYTQQPGQWLHEGATIADLLGITPVIDAIAQIVDGDCHPQLFETVGDRWDIVESVSARLAALGLPQDCQTKCASLSGGELAKLRLWQLFNADHQLLILDEPSNHLDAQSRDWLARQIRHTDAAVLLISHDRQLLEDMQEIWALSSSGIRVYGGNYSHYAEQKFFDEQALERQLNALNKQQQQLQRQIQRDHEKAQQRAVQGQKQRGSQAKCLLDSQKDRATAGASNRSKNAQARQRQLQQKTDKLRAAKVPQRQQAIYLASAQTSRKQVISVVQGRLAFGSEQRINLQVAANEKIHLQGSNGSGKSTLLKSIQGQIPLKQGELTVSSPLYYLDQHFSIVVPVQSLLDNLLSSCDGLTEADARTILAGIGFRRDRVYTMAGELSGGEKMKLAMLIVSHQSATQSGQPFLLLDEPDNHLDLDSKILLAQALNQHQGGFILISHDTLFAREAGCSQAYVM